MRYAVAILLAALLSAPAHATRGLLCRAESGEVPRISLVIGAGGIAGASLDEDGHWVSATMDGPLILAQAWIDREQAMADIVGQNWDHVAQLRVRFEPPAQGQPTRARGTLILRGRTLPVRCEEG